MGDPAQPALLIRSRHSIVLTRQIRQQSFTMKATFVASVLAFSALAVAAPNGGKKDWCKNGNYKKGEIKGDYDGYWPKKDYFTSTYAVIATPDQVINTTQIPEAPKGRAGPPRLASPNPQPLGDYRQSKG